MASNTDFVQYITDQCSGAGEIIAKKMFGDYVSHIVRETCKVLPEPKPKRKR
jgi:hypothetical protein